MGRHTRISEAKTVAALLAVAICPAAHLAAEHNAISPRPREIKYGAGRLALQGLKVCLVSPAANEDRFAARELAAALSIPFQEDSCPDRAIKLNRTGESDPLPRPGEKTGADSRESYSLHVTAGGVTVTARSSAGLYYAFQTLRQMVEGSPDSDYFPEVEIRDWPSLAYRGFMMDMSHAQLPAVDEIKRQIDFLARWKINQYLFYSEASIELRGYSLMPDAQYTQAQIRDIIGYARDRHIDVIPNVELYGHLHDLFRVERYADMSVIPHGGEFNHRDPRIQALLADWIGQLARLFPSPFFHIGFDETWLLEQEAKKAGRPADEIYLDRLNRTVALVEAQGKHPMVWADMMEKFPQIIPRVPKSIVAVPWHYFPLLPAEYDRILSPFEAAHVPSIVQAAVLNWNWIVPDYLRTFDSIDVLIQAGRKHGTLGFINSGWTDDTQVLMRLAGPAMAYGAIAAWQPEPPDRSRFFSGYAAALYSPAVAEEVAAGLELLARAETSLEKGAGTDTITAFWVNPFRPEILKRTEEQHEALRSVRLDAEDAAQHFRKAIAHDSDSTLRSFLVGAEMAGYAALKHIYAAEIAGFWRQLAGHPDHKDVFTLLYFETGFRYHSRTSDRVHALPFAARAGEV